jgi:hypothetical protein
MREKMSRPSSSVPNQCAAEGALSRAASSMCAGFCGASHGAKMANTVNITMSTIPAAASGLRRASTSALLLRAAGFSAGTIAVTALIV